MRDFALIMLGAIIAMSIAAVMVYIVTKPLQPTKREKITRKQYTLKTNTKIKKGPI